MSKHTKGPWNFYDDSNDGKTNRIEIVAIGKTVARIYHSVPDEDLPNARLISAAPDLLEALEEMLAGDSDAIDNAELLGVPFPSEMLITYKKAVAAIAKATGARQ